VSFASLSTLQPYAAWEATPAAGKLQIAIVGLILEVLSEAKGPEGHYMRGGKPGVVDPWFKANPIKLDPEESVRRELAELKHGRAAMLFLASLIAANSIPGSVPALTGATAFLG